MRPLYIKVTPPFSFFLLVCYLLRSRFLMGLVGWDCSHTNMYKVIVLFVSFLFLQIHYSHHLIPNFRSPSPYPLTLPYHQVHYVILYSHPSEFDEMRCSIHRLYGVSVFSIIFHTYLFLILYFSSFIPVSHFRFTGAGAGAGCAVVNLSSIIYSHRCFMYMRIY